MADVVPEKITTSLPVFGSGGQQSAESTLPRGETYNFQFLGFRNYFGGGWVFPFFRIK